MIQDADIDITKRICKYMDFERNIKEQIFDQKAMLVGNTSGYDTKLKVFYTYIRHIKDKDFGDMIVPETHYFDVVATVSHKERFNIDHPMFISVRDKYKYQTHNTGEEVKFGDDVLCELAKEGLDRLMKVIDAYHLNADEVYVSPHLPEEDK